ncbi:MAG: UDPGP type 1 family protein [Calditrichaeota bacterium]|nr:UDPGP type 1 family protein [Calditrichota bacterium]
MNDSRFRKIREKLQQLGQEHVLRFWDELSEAQRAELAEQVEKLEPELLRHLRQLLREHLSGKRPRGDLEPVEMVRVPTTDEDRARHRRAQEAGEEALRRGKVAALLVAGGQATRLGYPGPKGTFPIGPVTERSLYQYQAEKIRALGRRYGVTPPWAIMTSPATDEATRRFFEEHDFFGLDPNRVFFFVQHTVPALDPEGKLLLAEKHRIAESPNGHGGVFEAIAESGVLDQLAELGVEVLFHFQVDNPLIKICDPVFVGYHVLENAEMSAKVLKKRDPYEKLGVVGKLNGKYAVIEYSDLTTEEMEARTESGELKYWAGSIAIHCYNVDFVRRVLATDEGLPYHVAHKKVPHVDAQGQPVTPEEPNAYKFERFVFDALQFAERAVFQEVLREEEFSPVKNATGADSPDTARRDLTRVFAEWLEAAGVEVPRGDDGAPLYPLEISPAFAEGPDELRQKLPAGFKITGPTVLE